VAREVMMVGQTILKNDYVGRDGSRIMPAGCCLDWAQKTGTVATISVGGIGAQLGAHPPLEPSTLARRRESGHLPSIATSPAGVSNESNADGSDP